MDPLSDDMPIPPIDLHDAIAGLLECEERMKVARGLIRVPNVNAVEVVDFNGYGVVLYRDWP